jgi:hypothetical protein
VADLFPTDPRRIRDRIRRYERALQRELDAGYGSDGYGKRYVLGPLYMLLGDVDGGWRHSTGMSTPIPTMAENRTNI